MAKSAALNGISRVLVSSLLNFLISSRRGVLACSVLSIIISALSPLSTSVASAFVVIPRTKRSLSILLGDWQLQKSSNQRNYYHYRYQQKKFLCRRNVATFMTEPTPSASGTSTSTTTNIKLVQGIGDIVDQYDVFLLDMWGVMHDGFVTYEGVIDCVQKLRQSGKRLIILSNSSQRKEKSIQNLQNLGFENAMHDFEQVITSGEVAHNMLSGNTINGITSTWEILTEIQTRNQKNGQENKIFVLGSEEKRDVPYVESCGWKLAPIEQADLILASGTFTVDDGTGEINKRKDANAYDEAVQTSLEKAAARRLPMIVSNPDKVRPDFERPPMPGMLGEMYERALVDSGLAETKAASLVKRIGKPFGDVYDIALKDTTDLSRACMVGDALETDITGGSSAGIDTIWVLEDGVYIPELQEAVTSGKTLLEGATAVLDDFNRNKESTYAKGKADQLPTVAMPHFRW